MICGQPVYYFYREKSYLLVFGGLSHARGAGFQRIRSPRKGLGAVLSIAVHNPYIGCYSRVRRKLKTLTCGL